MLSTTKYLAFLQSITGVRVNTPKEDDANVRVLRQQDLISSTNNLKSLHGAKSNIFAANYISKKLQKRWSMPAKLDINTVPWEQCWEDVSASDEVDAEINNKQQLANQDNLSSAIKNENLDDVIKSLAKVKN